jgi:hypothetical protein
MSDLNTRMTNHIKAILSRNLGCLCGTFESCDVCNPHSELNRMRNEVLEAIRGTVSSKTVDDYGKIYLLRIPPDGVEGTHPGCSNHVSHPCEGCGRVGASEEAE